MRTDTPADPTAVRGRGPGVERVLSDGVHLGVDGGGLRVACRFPRGGTRATVPRMVLPDPVHATENLVEVRVPAAASAAATLRLLAASLAADAGFSFDDIDDIRLALNELFTSCATDQPGDRIIVTMGVTGDGFTAELSCESGAAPGALDELAVRIVVSVTDSFTDTAGRLRFAKQRSAVE